MGWDGFPCGVQRVFGGDGKDVVVTEAHVVDEVRLSSFLAQIFVGANIPVYHRVGAVRRARVVAATAYDSGARASQTLFWALRRCEVVALRDADGDADARNGAGVRRKDGQIASLVGADVGIDGAHETAVAVRGVACDRRPLAPLVRPTVATVASARATPRLKSAARVVGGR